MPKITEEEWSALDDAERTSTALARSLADLEIQKVSTLVRYQQVRGQCAKIWAELKLKYNCPKDAVMSLGDDREILFEEEGGSSETATTTE